MKTSTCNRSKQGLVCNPRELGVNGYQVAVMATRGESFTRKVPRTLWERAFPYAWYAGDIGKSEDRNRIVRRQQSTSGKSMLVTMRGGAEGMG